MWMTTERIHFVKNPKQFPWQLIWAAPLAKTMREGPKRGVEVIIQLTELSEESI